MLPGVDASHDFDECSSGVEYCGQNSFCNNTIGSFTCTCKNGYISNGISCDNIDECKEASTCGQEAVCVDTIGSYTCGSCETGDVLS